MINQKKTFTFNKKKVFAYSLALLGISSIVAATTLSANSSLTSSRNFNNTYNNNISNNEISDSNYDAIQNQEFTLNNNNAIDVKEKVQTSIKSNSYISGPDGYIANFDNSVKYMRYDDQTCITYPGIKNLIGSYYNSEFRCFVVLHSNEVNTISISLLSNYPDDPNISSLILDTRKFSITTDPNLSVLIPVVGTSTYMLIPQDDLLKNERSIKVFTIAKEYGQPCINMENSNLILEDNSTVNLKTVIISAGAINIDDKIYTFILSAINVNSANNIWLKVFKTDDTTYKSMALSQEVLLITDWLGTSLSDVKNKINDNIAEIYLTVNNFDVFCGVFINANPNKPSLIIGTYNIGKIQYPSVNEISPSLSKWEINLANINSNGYYNIINGRFFDDYFYGVMRISNQRNIIKLNLKKFINESIWMNSWDGKLLNWDGKYTNERIVLYDYAKFWSAPFTDDKSLIAQPFYNYPGSGENPPSLYDGTQNIFTYAPHNLYAIKAETTQYAYITQKRFKINYSIIPNVGNILVRDVTEEAMKSYVTQNLIAENITQYQKNSSYIFGNVSSSNSKEGTISVSVGIPKGYDSYEETYQPTEVWFDSITFAGFAKDTSSTTIDSLPENLPPKFESILAQNIVDLTNDDFRKYLFDNVIEGNKEGLNSSNIVAINIKSFDNSRGLLVLKTITLDKWYNYKTIETSEKVFSSQIYIEGFGKISSTKVEPIIPITGDLSKLDVSEIDNNVLNTWVEDNKNRIFSHLPQEATITIVNKTLLPDEGKIQLELEANQYYDSNFVLINSNSPGFVPLKQFTTIDGFMKKSERSSFPTLAVVLGVSGGVMAIILIILSIYLYKKKKNKKVNLSIEENKQQEN